MATFSKLISFIYHVVFYTLNGRTYIGLGLYKYNRPIHTHAYYALTDSISTSAAHI